MESQYGKEISDHLKLVVGDEYSDFVQTKILSEQADPQKNLLDQQMNAMNRKFNQLDNLKEFQQELDIKINYTKLGKKKLYQKLKELEKQQIQLQNEPYPYIKASGVKFMEIAKELDQEQQSDLKRNKILEFEAFEPLVPSERKEQFKLKYKYLDELGYSEYFETNIDKEMIIKESQRQTSQEGNEKKNSQKGLESLKLIKEISNQPKAQVQTRQDSPTRKLIIASNHYMKRKSTIYQQRFSKPSIPEREILENQTVGTQNNSSRNFHSQNNQYFQLHPKQQNKKNQLFIDHSFSLFQKNLDILAETELKRIAVDFNVPIKTIRSRNLESKNKKLEDEDEVEKLRKQQKRPNRLSKFRQLITTKIKQNFLAQEAKSIEQLSNSFQQQKAQFSERVLSEPSSLSELLKNKMNYSNQLQLEKKKKKQKLNENQLFVQAVVPSHLERSSLLEKEQTELIQKLLKFMQPGKNPKDQSEKIQQILCNRKRKSNNFEDKNNQTEEKIQ